MTCGCGSKPIEEDRDGAFAILKIAVVTSMVWPWHRVLLMEEFL
jgi:hypothetical protein